MAVQDFINKLLGRKSGKAGLVGLSWSEGEVAFAHIIRQQGEPQLRHCEVFSAVNDRERLEGLQKRVERLGLENVPCCFVLSPADYNLVLLERPNVEAHELVAAVKWKIKELIDRPLEDVAITVFPVPKGAYKNQVDMLYVVAARRDRILEAVDLVSKSGLMLSAIDIPELVMLNLSQICTDDSNGLAFIDLRPSGSTINLSRNGAVYLTRRLNTHVDEDVMRSADWDGVRERLVLEIQRSLDYFESQMGQSQVARLVIAPREEGADTLVKQLNDAMAVRVESMDLGGRLKSPQPIPFALQQSGLFAIGGALRQEQAA